MAKKPPPLTTTPESVPAPSASPIPARARGKSDRRRERLAGITGANIELTHDDVPVLETRIARIKWIVQRLNRGLWLTEHIATIADVWMCTHGAIREYAHVASAVVEVTSNDIETMAREAAQRIVVRGEVSEDERIGNEADKLILQLTGHLKGGRGDQPPSAAEVNAAIFESVRNPNDEMLVILRRAFSDPSDTLRGLLAEFSVVNAKGEER